MMKMTKSIALMMIGAGAVLAYQKYSKSIMNMISKEMNKTDKKLENMMK